MASEYDKKKHKQPHYRFLRAIKNAERRGKEWGLTEEEYVAIICNPCAYCGSDISGTGTAIDRIEDSRGYVAGNCNPCCTSCNRRRSKSMSAEEFKKQSELNRGEQTALVVDPFDDLINKYK